MLYCVALGGLAPDHPALVRRALANARGVFRRVSPQDFDTPFLDAIALPVAEKVWIETPAAKGAEVSAGLSKDGRFSARVPVADGANALVIRARTSDGAVHERRFAFTVDDRQRKQIEMRPEPESQRLEPSNGIPSSDLRGGSADPPRAHSTLLDETASSPQVAKAAEQNAPEDAMLGGRPPRGSCSGPRPAGSKLAGRIARPGYPARVAERWPRG